MARLLDRRLILIFAIVIGMGAVGEAAVGLAGYRIATESKPGQIYFDAAMAGTLHARVNLDASACLYVGTGSDETAIQWPYGYSAKGWPITVYGAGGSKIATVGDRIQLGGGSAPDGFGPIVGCDGFAHVWLASPPT